MAERERGEREADGEVIVPMKARTDLLPCPNGSADGTNHHPWHKLPCIRRCREPKNVHVLAVVSILSILLSSWKCGTGRVNFFHGNSFHRFQYRRSSFRSSGIIVISSFYWPFSRHLLSLHCPVTFAWIAAIFLDIPYERYAILVVVASLLFHCPR